MAARHAHVDVILEKDGNELKFELHSDDLETCNGNLVFKNDHHPGFWVFYHIVDPDKTDYTFPNDPDEALWVKKVEDPGADRCPDRAQKWDQFQPTAVLHKNKTLKVRNYNKYEAEFGYTLLVTKNADDPTAPLVKLDPGGTNRNGSQDYKALVGVSLLGGAVAGSLLMLGAKTLLEG